MLILQKFDLSSPHCHHNELRRVFLARNRSHNHIENKGPTFISTFCGDLLHSFAFVYSGDHTRSGDQIRLAGPASYSPQILFSLHSWRILRLHADFRPSDLWLIKYLQNFEIMSRKRKKGTACFLDKNLEKIDRLLEEFELYLDDLQYE